MAKHYTAAAPTPIFAVTYVSNRKGIVPDETRDNTLTKKQETNKQEIIKTEAEIKKIEANIDERDTNSLDKLRTLKAKLKDLGGGTEQPTASNVPDTEYLVYSNVEIQPTSDTDLSQQSNWFLRDAEAEVTRDWPICKAKLIITCKFNDDGCNIQSFFML